MSKLNDENINILLRMLQEEMIENEDLCKKNYDLKNEIDRIKEHADRLVEQIHELEKLRSQDLYEKELMLADVDSVVQRSKTIDDRD